MATVAFGTFKKTVTTAGTRVQLSSTQILARSVEIRALKANTGIIYVGDATVASTNGYALSLSDVYKFSDGGGNVTTVIDLSQIYLDSSANGEGVTVFYTK